MFTPVSDSWQKKRIVILILHEFRLNRRNFKRVQIQLLHFIVRANRAPSCISHANQKQWKCLLITLFRNSKSKRVTRRANGRDGFERVTKYQIVRQNFNNSRLKSEYLNLHTRYADDISRKSTEIALDRGEFERVLVGATCRCRDANAFYLGVEPHVGNDANSIPPIERELVGADLLLAEPSEVVVEQVGAHAPHYLVRGLRDPHAVRGELLAETAHRLCFGKHALCWQSAVGGGFRVCAQCSTLAVGAANARDRIRCSYFCKFSRERVHFAFAVTTRTTSLHPFDSFPLCAHVASRLVYSHIFLSLQWRNNRKRHFNAHSNDFCLFSCINSTWMPDLFARIHGRRLRIIYRVTPNDLFNLIQYHCYK